MPTREEIAEARQHARQFLHGPSIRIILAALDEALDVMDSMWHSLGEPAIGVYGKARDILHRNGRL